MLVIGSVGARLAIALTTSAFALLAAGAAAWRTLKRRAQAASDDADAEPPVRARPKAAMAASRLP